ncbi:MAG: DUF368 domain-containing protein [Bacteroidales bacterium]|nr:DUF368 domain-containing protein [Bacteroidales bacterium]
MKQQRSLKSYLLILLKGMGMGAADVVPGVSGGTIAFITGIYEELIKSLKSINFGAVKTLFRQGVFSFWKQINGNFLLAVFAGVLISIFTLAAILEQWLENNPILVWSFFFGLIIASAVYVARKIDHWNRQKAMALVMGVAAAYLISSLTPATTPETWWFVFFSGAIAICAMILPGISGAFILLLLGKYQFIIAAVNDLNIFIMAVFAAGAVVGLISFSNLLSWLLDKYHDITISVLSGFMIGSLFKIWPWKHTVSTFVDRHGETQPLKQQNVLPEQFEALTGGDAQLVAAIGMVLAGMVLILAIEWISYRKKAT